MPNGIDRYSFTFGFIHLQLTSMPRVDHSFTGRSAVLVIVIVKTLYYFTSTSRVHSEYKNERMIE